MVSSCFGDELGKEVKELDESSKVIHKITGNNDKRSRKSLKFAGTPYHPYARGDHSFVTHFSRVRMRGSSIFSRKPSRHGGVFFRIQRLKSEQESRLGPQGREAQEQPSQVKLQRGQAQHQEVMPISQVNIVSDCFDAEMKVKAQPAGKTRFHLGKWGELHQIP